MAAENVAMVEWHASGYMEMVVSGTDLEMVMVADYTQLVEELLHCQKKVRRTFVASKVWWLGVLSLELEVVHLTVVPLVVVPLVVALLVVALLV